MYKRQDYLTPSSLVKLAALLAGLGALAALARAARRTASNRRRRLYTQLLGVPAAILLLLAAVVTPIAYAIRLPHSPLNGSAVGRAVAALATADASPAPTRTPGAPCSRASPLAR